MCAGITAALESGERLEVKAIWKVWKMGERIWNSLDKGGITAGLESGERQRKNR
jgi:hypothetical protein